MAFPKVNPIDAGWLPRNIAIDHLGTTSIDCPVCDSNTRAEEFLVLVGSTIGFGAPFFVAPFLKRRSTAGKIGGTRVLVNQCCSCTSMFPADQSAMQWFASNGAADGVMSDASALKMANNRLGEAERLQAHSEPPGDAPTRARKIVD